MSKPKVYVTRRIPQKAFEILKDTCVVKVWEENTPPPYDVLKQNVVGMDGILTMLSDRVDPELLDTAGAQLRVVSNYAVGFDNIDVAAATERNVLVTNTPGVLTDTTADLAFALMLTAGRRLLEGVSYIKDGNWRTWEPQTLLGRDIHHATLGIIGMGKIGTAVARRAIGFEMKIIYYDHKHRRELGEEVNAKMCETLAEIFAEADFISIHVPLNPKTRHLIDANALDMMKPMAILINTSRGPVVDSDALYDALKTGKIAAAALDVTDPEPMQSDHKLLTLSNCLVVPHIGSASVATRERMAEIAATNLRDVLMGKTPKYLVNPEVLE